MTTSRALLAAAITAAGFGVAIAKLPAPPPMTEEQKAAAEEKKAKDAAAAKQQAEQLSRAEDRVAARYIQEMRAKGITVRPTPVVTVGTAVIGPPGAAATGTNTGPANTTAQGNTPPGASGGQSAEAEAPAKPAGAAAAATGPDASKDSIRK